MKRFFRLLLLATFLTACTESDDITTPNVGYQIAAIDAVIDNNTTRTYASQNSDGTIDMLWHENDYIALTDFSSKARYDLTTGADSQSATFSLNESSSDVTFNSTTLYAVSPYNRFATNSGNPTINISITQRHYSDNTNDTYRNIMVGTSPNNNHVFNFKLVAALARFSVEIDEGESISQIKMYTEDIPIAGRTKLNTQTLTLEEPSEKSITLHFNNKATSPTSEAFAIIAPVDFSKGEGKVYYEVVTNNSIYIFCKRPTKQFEAGYIYNFPLSINKFTQVDSYEQLTDGTYYIEKLFVCQGRTTDSTITIHWATKKSNTSYYQKILPNSYANFSDEITKEYKVALYNDEQCSDLVTSVSGITGSLFNNKTKPPRFCFSGLSAATTYYAKVWNVTDNTVSRPLKVSTSASLADRNNVVTSNAQVGDLILFENFEKLIYGGELSASGASISRTDRGSMTDLAPFTGEIIPSDVGYYLVAGSVEIGLFNTLKGLLDDFRLDDWGWIANDIKGTCARPGYLKIGTGSNRTLVCTPPLTAIGEGKAATVRVELSAAPYCDAGKTTLSNSDNYMSVKALSGITRGSNREISYTYEEDAKYQYLEGENNTAWEEYSFELDNVPSTGVVAIGGGYEQSVTNRILVDNIRITVLDIYDYVGPKIPEPTIITGTILYTDGTAASGVSVSDGFSVVQTDQNGQYSLTVNQDAWYIYYSTPANATVDTSNNGIPTFYKRYNEDTDVYDFTLTKCTEETKFNLFCLADPQCKDNSQCNRFKTESVPAIKSHAASLSNPCYGVTLGDIVYSEGSRNSVYCMPVIREHMAVNSIGMPIFQTMGNHDYTYFYTNKPIYADHNSSTFNLAMQRDFEDCFGPINHSFNRGDAHIICMRNMQWNSNTTWNSYLLCFTKQQVEWLEQDLSFVPKDKLVIFCVHVPLLNSSNTGVQDVLALLKQYPNCHIMSGHTHYMRNEPTRSNGIFEHVHAAVSGQWWWSTINGDGCPNGYGVYEIDGNTITNWYYQGVNEGMNSRDYQIRLYRGDLICGGDYEKYHLQLGNDIILANIFNADSAWSVKLYEDGVYSGDMELIPEKKYTYDSLIELDPNNQYPTYIPTDSGQDWWAIGYHIGVVGRNRTSGSYHTNCFHMFKYKLKNPNTTDIRVEATDRFGRTYSATEIIDNNCDNIYSSIYW